MASRSEQEGTRAGGPGGPGESIPLWLTQVGDPAWLVDAAGRLVFLNRAAAACLGVPGEECVGERCHAVVRGRGELAGERCREACPARALALAGRPVHSFVLRRGGGEDGASRWLLVQVFGIPGADAAKQGVFHVARDVSRMRRAYEYLVGSLDPDGPPGRSHDDRVAPLHALTPREREILGRLARNQDQRRIAYRLHISYATVRNHVQNLLRKIGAHSVQEAVALHVLANGGPA